MVGWFVYVAALGAYVGVGSRHVQQRLGAWCSGSCVRTGLLAGPLCVLGWIAAGTQPGGVSTSDCIAIPLYLVGVVLLARWTQHQALRQDQRAVWADLGMLCFLWVPFAVKWVPIWSIPPYLVPGGAHHSMVGPSPAVPLLAIPLALLSFTVIRPVLLFEYSYDLRKGDVTLAVAGYAFFVLVFGLPIGLMTGLAQAHIAPWPAVEVIGTAASLFFFPAILEEFFFRGVLLNLLASRLPGQNRRWVAMVVCAILFGLVHPAHGPYRLLAMLAGLCYGAGYLRTGRLLVPILMHTLVDFTWVYLFAP
jgi:membrane protease YdiL (CAAX protease family)